MGQQILSPSETLPRLHALVSLDQLPKMYGGTGPDIYHRKDNAESVSVPAWGKLSKSIEVPIDHTLTVDSYVNEGPLDIIITCTTSKSNTAQTLSPSITVKPSEEKEDGPMRNLQVIPPASDVRQVTVTWTNPAKFSSKPLIYVFTLSPQ